MAQKIGPEPPKEFEKAIKTSIEDGNTIQKRLRSGVLGADKEYNNWSRRNRDLLKSNPRLYELYISSDPIRFQNSLSNMLFHIEKEIKALDIIYEELIAAEEKDDTEEKESSVGVAIAGGFAGLVAGSVIAKKKMEQTLDKIHDLPRKYHIFIATSSDGVKKERKSVIDLISGAGYVPVTAEYSSSSDPELIEFYKSNIDDCDCVISLSSELGPETEYALEKGITVLTFVKEQDENGTGILWTGIDDLKEKVIDAIGEVLRKTPNAGWVRLKNVCSVIRYL